MCPRTSASYAPNSPKNETLFNYAKRIKARAVERCGELLKEIRPVPGARNDLQPRAGTDPRSNVDGRYAAGHAAKLSDRQIKTALRVAKRPEGSVRGDGGKRHAGERCQIFATAICRSCRFRALVSALV
jgi:hypothetical protein